MVDRLELEVHLPRLDTSEVADLETEQLGSVLLGYALGLVKGAQITANILLKRTSEDGEVVWLPQLKWKIRWVRRRSVARS